MYKWLPPFYSQSLLHMSKPSLSFPSECWFHDIYSMLVEATADELFLPFTVTSTWTTSSGFIPTMMRTSPCLISGRSLTPRTTPFGTASISEYKASCISGILLFPHLFLHVVLLCVWLMLIFIFMTANYIVIWFSYIVSSLVALEILTLTW